MAAKLVWNGVSTLSSIAQERSSMTQTESLVETTESAEQAIQAVEALRDARRSILEQVQKVIVGQNEVIDDVLTCLFSRGHALLVGVPGLAKTLLVSTIARVLDLRFKRIQFTPDLMPSDITGTDVIEEDPATGRRELKFFQGPLFANMVLADEINRTPPKTQAALLQAMQEKEVTVGTKTYKLSEPFLVLATQNPIEQEGTYPLPEAQQDRFMFNIYVGYPSEEEEIRIGLSTTVDDRPELKVVMGGDDILRYQKLVRRVPVADHVVKYAARLVRATRPNEPSAGEVAKKWIQWGAGPRAVQNLIIGGKARASLSGNFYVSTADIRSCAMSVLRHRILPNFAAEAEGIDSVRIVKELLQSVPEPKE
jgi:MoxR-like ATPase